MHFVPVVSEIKALVYGNNICSQNMRRRSLLLNDVLTLYCSFDVSKQGQQSMASSEGVDDMEKQDISAKGNCDACPTNSVEAQLLCGTCKKWLCIDHIQVTRQFPV